MREKDIERFLVEQVRALGGKAFKWVSPGNSGVPDRIVILPGTAPLFVELKTETGQLTTLQQVQIKRLRDLGQDVRILYGIGEVQEFLKGCEERKHGV